MTDDEDGLYRAVLANPADDAPRLVYADWLDETGDTRGEYLRLDLNLAQRTDRGSAFRRDLARATAIRKRLDTDWAVTISRGPSDLGKGLDLFRLDVDHSPERRGTIEAPTWEVVEAGFRQLNGRGPYFARLRFGWSRIDDFVYAMGGPEAFGIVARLSRLLRYYLNKAGRPDVRYELGGGVLEESKLCFDLETVIRAAKWAYYYQTFAPDVSWTGDLAKA
jgi:uncharacterized protein (TIGR02996 family)